MTIPEQAVENERAVNALPLIEELRERTALRYMGDCKCGKCQLVPKELIVRVMNELEWLSRAAQPYVGVIRREDVARAIEQCAKIVEGRVYKEHYREWPEWGPANHSKDRDTVKLCNALAAAIRALPHTGQPQEGDDERKGDLLAKALAGAELNYRDAYERHGGGHIETGRRWDKMRRAGNAIRQHFYEIEECVSASPALIAEPSKGETE